MDDEKQARLELAGWFVGDVEDFIEHVLGGVELKIVKGRKGKSDKYTFDDKRKMTDD